MIGNTESIFQVLCIDNLPVNSSMAPTTIDVGISSTSSASVSNFRISALKSERIGLVSTNS